MNISELMTPHPEVVRATAPLSDAAHRLRVRSIRHLPVIDDDGVLTGMLTDSAAFQRGTFLDQDRGWHSFVPGWDGLTAGDVAIDVDVAIRNRAPAEEALRKLVATRQDALVVINDARRPVGIFTEHDALTVALEVLDEWRTIGADRAGGVVTRPADAVAVRALDDMLAQDIRHVVVRGDDLHVVSQRDLIMHDVRRRPELLLSDCVGGPAMRGTLGDSMRDLAVTMREHGIGCVPVVDARGELVSIVTRHDVLVAVLDAMGG